MSAHVSVELVLKSKALFLWQVFVNHQFLRLTDWLSLYYPETQVKVCCRGRDCVSDLLFLRTEALVHFLQLLPLRKKELHDEIRGIVLCQTNKCWFHRI